MVLLPALPVLRRARLHVVEPLEHNIEHVAGVGLHGSVGVLEPGKVWVGRVGSSTKFRLEDGSFDTSVSLARRRRGRDLEKGNEAWRRGKELGGQPARRSASIV